MRPNSRTFFVLCALAAAVVAGAFGASPTLAPDTTSPRWRLAFSDEFDEDLRQWSIITSTDDRLQSLRSPAQVRISDGWLYIDNRRNPDRGPPWLGGFIRSRSHCQAYGYFEARLRYARGAGLDNAFWLISDRRVSDGGNEIDINEGWYPRKATSSIHVKNRSKTWTTYLAADGSERFHTYGLLWLPGRNGRGADLTWFIDGKAVNRTSCKECVLPTRINLSTAVLAMSRPSQELDGSSMIVDWVRTYQLQGMRAPSTGCPVSPAAIR